MEPENYPNYPQTEPCCDEPNIRTQKTGRLELTINMQERNLDTLVRLMVDIDRILSKINGACPEPPSKLEEKPEIDGDFNIIFKNSKDLGNIIAVIDGKITELEKSING